MKRGGLSLFAVGALMLAYSCNVSACPSFSFHSTECKNKIQVCGFQLKGNQTQGAFKMSVAFGGWGSSNYPAPTYASNPPGDPIADSRDTWVLGDSGHGVKYFELRGTYQEDNGKVRLTVNNNASSGGTFLVKDPQAVTDTTLLKADVSFTEIVLSNVQWSGNKATTADFDSFAMNISNADVNNTIGSSVLDAFDQSGTGTILGKTEVHIEHGNGRDDYKATAETTCAAVPEVNTILLLATGISMLGGIQLRRRRRRLCE